MLVASHYRNQPVALWNLPGGRARAAESFAEAVVRELLEETGLMVEGVPEIRYVSESLDRTSMTRFINATFAVRAGGEPVLPDDDAHVVGVAWVPRENLAERLTVRVVREPLLAHLADPARRYFPLGNAGISIEFSDDA